MRLVLLRALRDRFRDHADMAAWATLSGQAIPRIVVGYRQARTAQDWPFIALVGIRGKRRLNKRQQPLGGQVALLAGVRHDDASDDGSGGYALVDSLTETALGILAASPSFTLTGLPHVRATEAEQVEQVLAHPNYMIETHITFEAI